MSERSGPVSGEARPPSRAAAPRSDAPVDETRGSARPTVVASERLESPFDSPKSSAPVRAPPLRVRSPIATRILSSFAITVVAFTVTTTWAIFAQNRAAEDSAELATGYVPSALKLGQLRAAQETLSALVDGIPDERNPASTRLVLQTLVSTRRTKILETRAAIRSGLGGVASQATREKADQFTAELDAIDGLLEGDRALFEQLFAAVAAGDQYDVNAAIVNLGALEHEAAKRLRTLSDRVRGSMDALSLSARARAVRATYALIALALITLLVGIFVSVRTRRLLVPLARVTERARAVASGDLAARPVEATDDEIGHLARTFETMVLGVARAQAAALANERLAAIGKMAAHVTHEIRNPLSSIGLNVELLEEELLNDGARPESRSLLSSIKREVDRLEQLSEEYLRLARLPSPRMEAGDVAVLVKELVAFSNVEMMRAGCHVRVITDGNLPTALFDESQLRQALVNILRNAREAMPAGGEIDVRVYAEGLSVVVAVEDRGGGIPEEIRTRVFDPFFSTKGEGTGLGLAITRQIIDAHGGTIRCEIREGGGTRFLVTVPMATSR